VVMKRSAAAVMCAGLLAATVGAAGQPAPGKPAGTRQIEAKAAASPLQAFVDERVESVLRALSDDGDFAKAGGQLRGVFDVCVAYGQASDAGPMVTAAGALRMVTQLGRAAKEIRLPLLEYLRANPVLAEEMAFTVSADDDAAAAYGILARLRAAYTLKPAAYPALTAAVCVVYDRPRAASISPPKPAEPVLIDPVEVFGYFLRNEARLGFGVRDLPPELLVYMVDTRATVPELEWAMGKHAGDRNVGKRYDDLTYDTAFFKQNKPKKIAAMAYTLQNLRQVGGVCEEQAYYAAHVARAVGVPATEIGGRSADAAHAWVGFLQVRGGPAVWNTEEGHYDQYKDLEGKVQDPQTGRIISDTTLAMTAEAARVLPAARHQAAALIDGARRLGRAAEEKAGKGTYPPVAPVGVGGLRGSARSTDAAGRLELLNAACGAFPGSVDLWAAVREAAPVMSGSDRARWFAMITKVCGDRYRRFGFHVMASMIGTIENPREQSDAWDWAFRSFRQLPDLAAAARIAQGKKWEEAGDRDRAYAAYVDVAQQFPNEGPFVVEALGLAEAMLVKAGKNSAAAEMYREAWRRISRPGSVSTVFFSQSNFYRVGDRYAQCLEKAGRMSEAAAVRRQIEAGVEKDK